MQTDELFLEKSYLFVVYKSYTFNIYKQDLALNNLQGLLCHKIQPTYLPNGKILRCNEIFGLLVYLLFIYLFIYFFLFHLFFCSKFFLQLTMYKKSKWMTILLYSLLPIDKLNCHSYSCKEYKEEVGLQDLKLFSLSQ